MPSTRRSLKAVTVVLAALPALVTAGEPSVAVVPRPASMRVVEGRLLLPAGSPVVVEPVGDLRAEVADLRLMTERIAGLHLGDVVAASAEPHVALVVDASQPSTLGDEGYRLSIDSRRARVAARTPQGVFRGVQTLLQLLPLARSGEAGAVVVLPALEIEDHPRFAWRSMHLDVSRHFRSADFVKRFIDVLALHKINVFHWHLTDDQGWRIQIRKHPRLTEVGAWRAGTGEGPWEYEVEPVRPGETRYGGFYTQDEIRAIVAYAAARHVTIVPEIEMPGHSWAALLAYPELSCSGVPWKKPADVPFEFSDPFCAGNEKTFALLEDVLTETMELFPSTFIHVGGDEAKKTPWQTCPKCQARMKAEGLADVEALQSWFMKRIERFVASRGRRVIGWDEILEGGLPPGAAVMSWRGEEGGIEAARHGHDVVMTPGHTLYFNAPQWPAGGDRLDLDRVHGYDPVPPVLGPGEKGHVLGVGACLWGEQLFTDEIAERQLLPRLGALAEVAWSPAGPRDPRELRRRMPHQFALLARLGYRPFVEPPGGLADTLFIAEPHRVELSPPFPGGQIHYTVDGAEPTPDSPVYGESLEVRDTTTIKAAYFLADGPASAVVTGQYRRAEPSPAVQASVLQPGLRLRILEGAIDTLDHFDRLTPSGERTAASVGIPAGVPADHFGLEFGGLLAVPATGVYTFFLSSDDGSRLWIDEALLVDHDGTHAATERRGAVALAEGAHTVRLRFFEGLYGEALALEWEGPGLERQPVAGEAFHHEAPTTAR